LVTDIVKIGSKNAMETGYKPSLQNKNISFVLFQPCCVVCCELL